MRRPPIVPFRGIPSGAFGLRVFRRDPTAVPLHAPGLHGHRFFTLNFFTAGEGHLRRPGGVVRVAEGHLGLELPGELYEASGLRDTQRWVAEFTEDLLGGLELAGSWAAWGRFAARPWGTPLFAVVPAEDRPDMEVRMERMERELREQRSGHREAARALLHLVLVDLARLLPGKGWNVQASPLALEALAVIDRRFAEPISLAEVARAVGRSPSHLTAAVREHTGMTVLQWITERRMADARRRLQQTDEEISIIAERVGYADPAYFTRLFRRAHGRSPREFRSAIDKSS